MENQQHHGRAELVLDIRPGSYPDTGYGAQAKGSNPRFLTNVAGTLFFTATDATHGEELWRINSSGAAEFISDIRTGADFNGNPYGANIQHMTAAGGTLYFTAFDGSGSGNSGQELWRATATGPAELVTDIVPGSGSSIPNNLTNVAGTLFFTANNTVTDPNTGAFVSGNGIELWRVNNTSGLAELVTDIFPGVDGNNPNSSNPAKLTASGEFLFFSAFDGHTGGGHGTELWRAASTGAAVLAADITPGNVGSSPGRLANLNGTLFFNATDNVTDPDTGAFVSGNGYEVWRITGIGTAEMLEDTVAGGGIGNGLNNYGSGPAGADAFGFTPVGGTMFFSANDRVHGTELWRTTATGMAELVGDINPNYGSTPNLLTNVEGTLYFSATDSTHGNELWRFNNTTGQVEMAAELNTGSGNYGPQGSNPSQMTGVNGVVYFRGADGFGRYPSEGTNGYELWRLGTFEPANTPPIADDDTGTTDENTTTNVNVLDGDTDGDGDTLTVLTIDDTGTVGEISDNGDGTVEYDPNGQFEYLDDGQTATDTFHYTVSDGNGGSDTATVTITITGVNDAPNAVDDSIAVSEGGTATTLDPSGDDSLLDNDTDTDSATLTVTGVNGPGNVGTEVPTTNGCRDGSGRRDVQLHARRRRVAQRQLHLHDQRRHVDRHRHGDDHGQRRERSAHADEQRPDAERRGHGHDCHGESVGQRS